MIRYTPGIYEVRSLEEAKHAIVSPERWESETDYLVEDIGKWLKPTEETVILDYGCGVGRLAKPLIEKFGCRVIGIEISVSMRRLALEYVNSERFTVRHLEELGWPVDHALAVWVLQHCPAFEQDVRIIKAALKSDGLFYVVNNFGMLIPTNTGWVDDGRDVRNYLKGEFEELHYEKFPIGPQEIANRSYISLYEAVR